MLHVQRRPYIEIRFLQALLHNLCIISGYDREKLLSFVINTSGAIEHTYFLVNLF